MRLQEKKIEAYQARQNFVRPTGDHFTLLNVFNEWADSGFSIAWTYEYVYLAHLKHELTCLPGTTYKSRVCRECAIFEISCLLCASGSRFRLNRMKIRTISHRYRKLWYVYTCLPECYADCSIAIWLLQQCCSTISVRRLLQSHESWRKRFSAHSPFFSPVPSAAANTVSALL